MRMVNSEYTSPLHAFEVFLLLGFGIGVIITEFVIHPMKISMFIIVYVMVLVITRTYHQGQHIVLKISPLEAFWLLLIACSPAYVTLMPTVNINNIVTACVLCITYAPILWWHGGEVGARMGAIGK